MEENANDANEVNVDEVVAVNNKNSQPSIELLKKIKLQIEYYFGNVNMQRDKFLIEQTKLDEGWIPITVMLNFKMLASLSKDIPTILQALESSDLMEISEDSKKIRRSLKHPLPIYNEEYRQAQEARTIYIKGFSLTDTTIDSLKIFFEQYKPFETIVMRKYLDNKDKKHKFKGSVYVQFETLDGAKAFMDIESIKYEDTELIRKWAADYVAEKVVEKEEHRRKKSEKKSANEKVKQTEDKKEDKTTDIKLPKGAVIYFSGVPKICTREDIKECLEQLGADIAYVDFHRGNAEGWVRLYGADTAKPLIEKTDQGTVIICKEKVACKALEGAEEDEYLTKVTNDMINLKNKRMNMKRGKKGRGGRVAKKRSINTASDDPPIKTSKNEADST